MSSRVADALPFLGDKYEVVGKMGEGGMGTVYRVHHKLLDEDRVVKVMKGSSALDATARKRFLREARAAAQLRHPSIAQLYDFSVEEDGTSYIVLEFIDGKDLGRVIADHGAPSLEFAVEVLVQGLEAIQLLHSKGFVHRDIAPDNLMLTRDVQGAPATKLIDLGIVKSIAGDTSIGGATAVGTFVGKARYTAPEQFKEGGSGNLRQPSDLYGFGVLAYELLTGRCPIAGKTFSDVLSHQLFKPPLSFDESDPQGRVPAELRRLILDALEKSPADRIQTADEFLDRLRPFRQEGSAQRERLKTELAKLLGPPVPVVGDEDATVILRRDDVLRTAAAGAPPAAAPPAAPPPAAPPPPVAEHHGSSREPVSERVREQAPAPVPEPPAEAAAMPEAATTSQLPEVREPSSGKRSFWRRLLGLR